MIHYDHRILCLHKRLRDKSCDGIQELAFDAEHKVYIDQTKSVKYELNRASMYLNCKNCDDWYRNQASEDIVIFEDELPGSFYDPILSVFPPDANLNNVLGLDLRCGIDAEWLSLYSVKYSEGEVPYKFYHISIRHQVWENFLERIAGMDVYFLPYWCLCDSGRPDASEIHRHMIIVTRFEGTDITRGLKDSKGNGQKLASFSILIDSYKHLMSVINYVCDYRSQCTLSDPKKNKRRKHRGGGTFGRNHFYVGKNIIPRPCSTFVMSFFHPDGIQAMCNINYASASVTDTLCNVSGISRMSDVKLSDMNVVENHIIPIVHNVSHSLEYTNMRLELGPTACKTGYIVRCFMGSGPGHTEYTVEEFNKRAADNGSVMYNVAMSSIYKLNEGQRDILKRVGELMEQNRVLMERTHLFEVLERQNAIIIQQNEGLMEQNEGLRQLLENRKAKYTLQL
jgi:hypothetical protein